MSRLKGDLFHIRIGQHLDVECAAWVADLTIMNLAGGEAMLSGTLADQAALYGVLQCLHDLNIPLLEIRRGEQPVPIPAA